jgi:hypothetical protein
MAGRINKKLLNDQILNSSAVKKMVNDIVNKEVRKQKAILLNNFENHPVTKEIEAGENSSNISGTLGGYGNLFSFIGFEKGSNPVNPIKELLNKITVKNVFLKNNTFNCEIIIPSKEEFSSVSKMPWESGRSWLFDMEKSISGMGEYLYGIVKKSRSGSAIQIKNAIFKKSFKSVRYFNTMYNNFIKELGAK